MRTLDLKQLESALESRARDLRRALTERSPIAVEREADPFDEQVLAAARESSAQILARDFRLLQQVEAARTRLREGAFGMCLSCEEEIAMKRLLAVPWTMFCVSCQARIEEAGKFPAALSRAA